MSIELNWIAIVVLGIAHFALGAIWFGPLFGGTWMRIHYGDKKPTEDENKEMMRGMWKLMLAECIACLLMTIALACLVAALPEMPGWRVGLMSWAGFILPISASNIIWGNDKRENMITKISLVVGYRLIAFVTIGAVLSVW